MTNPELPLQMSHFRRESNMVASEVEVPTFQLADKIGTKSQRQFLCFVLGVQLSDLVLVVMLIDQTGSWNFKMVASKLQIYCPSPRIYA